MLFTGTSLFPRLRTSVMASPGPWRSFLDRSVGVIMKNTSGVTGLRGIQDAERAKLLFTYRSAQDLRQHVTGCDADIGGKSSVHLDLVQNPGETTGTAKFWGDMRLEVPRGKEETMRSGYAGFRSRIRTTLFGHMVDDLSLYDYLAFRVRASGEPRTRSAYFVNLQTDGPVPSDLWQHRLFLNEEADGKTWEDVIIPLNSFVLTSGGETATGQVSMSKGKVRTIGISILGGNAHVSGRFELGVDYVGALQSPEDIDQLTTLAQEEAEHIAKSISPPHS